MKQIIPGATLVNEGRQVVGSVCLSDERIESIYIGVDQASELPDELLQGVEIVDAHGLWLLPGCIDDQIHFREPGPTHKGDIAYESRAAVAGGVTSYMDMPNVKPPTITLEALLDKRQRTQETSWANYAFYFGGTNDNAPEACTIDPALVPGYKLFPGASAGNVLMDSEEALDYFFAHAPKLIATHCESEEIITCGKEPYRQRYDGHPPIETHPLIRSRETCYASSHSAIECTKRLGARLHMLHLSTAEEMELFSVAPLSPEKRITAEVCVHHLWFTDEDYSRLGSRIKWSLAVKTARDHEALRQVLVEGHIDVMATDHAPHILADKESDALTAASGGSFVQHSLLMTLELAHEELWSPELVVERMAHAPAQLFGVRGRGYIRTDYCADPILVDPHQEITVTKESPCNKCGWSPLEGHIFSHHIVATWVNGQIAYRDGQLTSHPPVHAPTPA